MLEVSLRAGDRDVVVALGNLEEILADLTVTIKAIHAQMANVEPAAAELFKETLKVAISDENGLVWGNPPLRFTGMGFSVPGNRKGGNE